MRFYYLIYLKIGTKLWQQLGLSAGTVITKETKEPNHRVLLGLYCLVPLVLLLYVICASVPTEGT